jgi:hypothetical protein
MPMRVRKHHAPEVDANGALGHTEDFSQSARDLQVSFARPGRDYENALPRRFERAAAKLDACNAATWAICRGSRPLSPTE